MAEPDGTGPMFSGWELWYIVPVAFLVVVLAVGGIAVSALSGTESTDAAADAKIADLPPYWIVKADQTYSDIAEKTGLSVEQLEAFNPRTNPTTIRPGQRIKLREKVPPAAPKPLGPKFWTVRKGQSFGSIAAATGKPIDRLHRAQQAPEARGAQARRPRAAAALRPRRVPEARPRVAATRPGPEDRPYICDWIFFSVSRSSARSVSSRCASASATGSAVVATGESVCAAPAEPVSSAARSSTASASRAGRRLGGGRLGSFVDLLILVLCHGAFSVVGYGRGTTPTSRRAQHALARRHSPGEGTCVVTDTVPCRPVGVRLDDRDVAAAELAAEAQLERAAVRSAHGDVARADPAERLERGLARPRPARSHASGPVS